MAQHVYNLRDFAGVNAPGKLLLNIQNSLVRGDDIQETNDKRSNNPVCQLSFYSPYWVDNRTNMDLVIQDHASAKPAPVSLGLRLPTQYSEVQSPGKPSSAISNREGNEVMPICEFKHALEPDQHMYVLVCSIPMI